MSHINALKPFVRAQVDTTLREAQYLSGFEPHRIFYVLAIPCPKCRRHALGTIIVTHDELERMKLRKKYTLAVACAGTLASSRRH